MTGPGFDITEVFFPMEEDAHTKLRFIEGHPCTIGRDGQIRIEDPCLSRGHAEIRFVNGKLRLRDLGSTNGTFLVEGNRLIPVEESFVGPNQKVVLGSAHYTIKALLALAGIYVSYRGEVGLVVKSACPDEETVTVKTDVDEIVSRTIASMLD